MKTKKYSKTEIKNVTMKNDFYSFVNKKWINHVKIPANEPIINHFSKLNKKIDNQLKQLIKMSSNTNLITIYKNSLKWNDDEVKKTMLSFVKEMYSLFNGDIYKFFAFLITNGFGSIITINIEQCIYNPKKRVLSLDAAEQIFPPYYYQEEKYRHYLDFYEHFLKKWFNVFEKKDISHIIEIETFISKQVKTKTFLRKIENSYFLMSNEECIKKCNFDWKKLLTYLNVDCPKKIIIRQPEYLKKIMVYFKNWNTEFFEPFWTYKILSTGGNFHSELYDLKNMFQKFIYEVKKPPLSSDRILGNVKFFMNFHLNELYNKKMNNILFCKNLIDKAIIILIKRLEGNQWLSKETIKKAIKKIKNVQIFIGCKPKTDEDIEIVYGENMFENYVKLYRAILKNNTEKINDIVYPDTRYLGDMDSYEVNANYSSNNIIFIPNAILQPPFVTKNYIHTLAFLGIIVCHELIHALDDEGCKYDENGIYNNWWKPIDKEKYNKIKKKVLKLFEHYSKNNDILENLKMGENIADLSSIKIIEDILDDYLDKNNIVNKEFYFKEFYKNYAKLYRTQNYKSYYEIVKNDYHSYGKFRINCILANSEKFRKYLKITDNDKMYSETINIW